ncbi:MAG TPA: hypothetical protein V6D28_04005 [Leptolyngbyaceae cyanobacterium]
MMQTIATIFSTVALTSLIVFGYWWERKQDPSHNLPLWIEIPSFIVTLLVLAAFPALKDTSRYSRSRGDGSRDGDGDD